MSFDQILEELPNLTAEEKGCLWNVLESELSWAEEEEQILEEGLCSRREEPMLNFEKFQQRIQQGVGWK